MREAVLDALKHVDRNMFYNLSPKIFKEIRIIPDFKKFLCFNFNTSLYLTLEKKWFQVSNQAHQLHVAAAVTSGQDGPAGPQGLEGPAQAAP